MATQPSVQRSSSSQTQPAGRGALDTCRGFGRGVAGRHGCGDGDRLGANRPGGGAAGGGAWSDTKFRRNARRTIVWQIRLPRVLMAAALVGGVAGALRA